MKDLQGQLNTAGHDRCGRSQGRPRTIRRSWLLRSSLLRRCTTRGVTFTPGGFAAAESVYRSRSINSDINTPVRLHTVYELGAGRTRVSSTPPPGSRGWHCWSTLRPRSATWAHTTRWTSSPRGTTSNDNQTNSYTLRQREIWAQIATNSGFTLTAGQMWTLATEVKEGDQPGSERGEPAADDRSSVPRRFHLRPAVTGVRFAQSLGPKQNIAASIEESQTILAAVSNAPSNFFFGSAGVGGGLYNSTANYSNNVAPDILVKYTADPGYGHYEGGRPWSGSSGIATTRPSATPQRWRRRLPQGTGVNSTAVGGGFFANARFPVTHYLDIGLHVMQGTGTGLLRHIQPGR